jgi:hypothetical protein
LCRYALEPKISFQDEDSETFGTVMSSHAAISVGLCTLNQVDP